MADQAINALPTKSSPSTGDKVLMIGTAEEYQILVDDLATAVLDKLTSKSYTLDQGTKTLIAALNELNSKITSVSNADIDNLDRSKPFVIGTLTTESEYINTYPASGTFMQIRGNSTQAASQFIFASSGKIYYRRYYNSVWNDWYLFNGTIVNN